MSSEWKALAAHQVHQTKANEVVKHMTLNNCHSNATIGYGENICIYIHAI